jgi:CCR4-NOT transcriptional regulation complex NOT5 subunit
MMIISKYMYINNKYPFLNKTVQFGRLKRMCVKKRKNILVSADNFVCYRRITVGLSADNTLESAENIMLSADSTRLSFDNTMLSADTTIILVDNTMLSVDTTFVSADTTFVSADTTLASADNICVHGNLYLVGIFGLVVLCEV